MTIALYITRLLIWRVAASLLAVAALLQLFDLLNNARQLLSRGGTISDLATYAVLRLPATLEQALPIAMLIGALATLLALARSNEIVVLRSSGMTIYRIFLICLPTAIATATIHFVLVDTITPVSERRFSSWWASFDSAAATSADRAAFWLRSPDAIMRIEGFSDGGRALIGIKVVQLSDKGLVTGWTDADTAHLTSEGWIFRSSRTMTVLEHGAVAIQEEERRRWPSALDPASIVEVTTPAESRSTAQLRQILQGAWAGGSGTNYYLTRLYRSYALPLASLLMLLLALPAAYMSRRRGDAGRYLGLGFGLGMGYLIIDGLLAALGSAGALPPVVAAWSAPTLLALIGMSVVLHHEE